MSETRDTLRSRDPLWLAGILAMVGVAVSVLPLRSWDYWYHLTVGRLLAHHHQIPDRNIFSYVAEADTPVFVQPWLGDFWLYSLHAMGGLPATILVRNLSVLVTFGIIGATAYVLSRRNPVAAAVLTGIFGLAFLPISALTGPRMFAWPLFAVLAAVGVAVTRRRAPPWALVLFVLAAAFWANLAGDFLVPTVLASALAEVDRRRNEHVPWPFIIAAVASAAAVLATPHGVGIFAALGDTGGLVDWAILAAPLLLAPLASDVLRPPVREASPWLVGGPVALVVAAVIALQPWSEVHTAIPAAVLGEAVRQEPPLRGHGPSSVPIEPVEVLRSWGRQPRVFAEPRLTGYLLYELQDPLRPLPVVWPLPDHDGADLMREAMTDAQVFRGAARQHGIDAVVVTPALEPLAEQLVEASEWERVDLPEKNGLLIRRPARQ